MARYGKIESGFWHNPKVRQLTERGRFLLAYMFSCPHGNSCGCFVLPDGYVAADMGWPLETVSETLSELFQKGFLERDNTSNLARIVGWWGHNKIENANVAKFVAKEIASLPNCVVRQHLIDDLLSQSDLHETVTQTLSERLPKPIRNQEPNLTIQEPNNTQAPKAPLNADFEDFWKVYPKRDGANPKEPAKQKFAAAVKSGADPGEITAAAGRYAAECMRKQIARTDKVAQAVTWLNQKRWGDYPASAAAAPQETDWVSTIERFQKFGTWPRGIGGEPGMVSCHAPPEILQRFGYEPTKQTETQAA
jgi:hypothetical protein